MPSTDRLLWLLQMALFLAAPLFVLATVAAILMGVDVEGCASWIYTDAMGQEFSVRIEPCGDFSTFAGLASLALMWVFFTGLGAVIFCLRRIGRAMGAD